MACRRPCKGPLLSSLSSVCGIAHESRQVPGEKSRGLQEPDAKTRLFISVLAHLSTAWAHPPPGVAPMLTVDCLSASWHISAPPGPTHFLGSPQYSLQRRATFWMPLGHDPPPSCLAGQNKEPWARQSASRRAKRDHSCRDTSGTGQRPPRSCQ